MHDGGGSCRWGADVGLSTGPNSSNTQQIILYYKQLSLPKQSGNSTLNTGLVPSDIHRRGNKCCPPLPPPCSIQYCGSKANCAAAWSKCCLHVSPSNRCQLGKPEPFSCFCFVCPEGPKSIPVGGDGGRLRFMLRWGLSVKGDPAKLVH